MAEQQAYICNIAICPNNGKKCWEHSPYNLAMLCPHMYIEKCPEKSCTHYIEL